MSIYDFEVKDIDGKMISLSNYENQVIMIVNTASRCHFTEQFNGLESLYQKYKEKGFVILGFPCNQFAHQEPNAEVEIKKFCALTYQVSFPLFSKIDVNGEQADPLFKYLKSQKKGILGSEFIKWNFTKFLVDRKGNVVQRFAPRIKPEDIIPSIAKLL